MSNKRNSAVEMKTLETPLCIIKPSAGTNTCKEAICLMLTLRVVKVRISIR